jgi:hypothetical protein
VFDKRLLVALFAAPQQPQPIFQRSERTNNTSNRLGSDDADGREMCHAEPKVPNEFPSPESANPDQKKSKDNERHKRGVENQDQVRQHQVKTLFRCHTELCRRKSLLARRLPKDA